MSDAIELSHADLHPQVYITPRAAREALNVGIIAVRLNVPVVRQVQTFINERFDRYSIDDPLEERAFVMRWSGPGGIVIGRGDTMYIPAMRRAPHTRYMNAGAMSMAAVSSLILGDELEGSVRVDQLPPNRTVEVNIDNWEQPRFAEQLVRGVLYTVPSRLGKNAIQNAMADISDALAPEPARKPVQCSTRPLTPCRHLYVYIRNSPA